MSTQLAFVGEGEDRRVICLSAVARNIVALIRARGPHVVILRGKSVYAIAMSSTVAADAIRDYAHRIVGIYTSRIATQDIVDDLGEAFADWSRRDL